MPSRQEVKTLTMFYAPTLLMCGSTNSPSQITCKSLLNRRQDLLKTTLRGNHLKLECFPRLHPAFYFTEKIGIGG